MTPVFWTLIGLGVTVYAALTVLEMRWRSRVAREARELQHALRRSEQCRLLASQARFMAQLRELRENEDGCEGGHPVPGLRGLTILGETDAQIADELIRLSAPHGGSRA